MCIFFVTCYNQPYVHRYGSWCAVFGPHIRMISENLRLYLAFGSAKRLVRELIGLES